MRIASLTLAMASGVLLLAAAPAFALDPPAGRVELKRADLSGAPGMEVTSSITEFKPGDTVIAHVHHGIEAGYMVQGAMVLNAGAGTPTRIETGTPVFNLRDVAHGGYKVVGDTSLKIFAVHIVDKANRSTTNPARTNLQRNDCGMRFFLSER